MAILIQRALSGKGNGHCKEEPLSSVGQGQRALQEGGEMGNAGQSWANKKSGHSLGDILFCARDESRTHTSQLTLAPETSASTISPPAPGHSDEMDCKYTKFLDILKNKR